MATMVKEKRREKKKSKDNHITKSSVQNEQPSLIDINKHEIEVWAESKHTTKSTENYNKTIEETSISDIKAKEILDGSTESKTDQLETNISSIISKNIISESVTSIDCNIVIEMPSTSSQVNTDTSHKKIETSHMAPITPNEGLETRNIGKEYEDLNLELHRIKIPSLNPELEFDKLEEAVEKQRAYNSQESLENELVNNNIDFVNVIPSAPIIEREQITEHIELHKEIIKNEVPKVKCMPLEEAIQIFGGKDIEEIRILGDREEAIVEAGPLNRPEHPLVDLLTTFRCSLIAVERERTQLSLNFIDEEKYRTALWKIEKRHICLTEKCPCGLNVELKAVYDHAEFLSEKLPVAKMKLEGILRDVQDSYCHHQHAALLAHCQIEELVSEVTQSNKREIREALALILQALRLSDGAPEALPTALQRWATALASALVDARDVCQLLHLLQHLFRQSRSVQWASDVIRFSVVGNSSAAQLIAILDLLLARPRLEAAQECTEDTEEAWEEMDRDGCGAVSSGALRERDMLALLRALPLRELVARLVLFTHSDIRTARDYEWGDHSGGRSVLLSCCGVRSLLHVLQRACDARAHYDRLRTELRTVARAALKALQGLYQHTRSSYTPELADKISAELSAVFAAGFALFGARELHTLPAGLLGDGVAMEYCHAFIGGIHDKSPRRLESLSMDVPVMSCNARVRAAVGASVERPHDQPLARLVLQFLMMTGLKRRTSCKAGCDQTARDSLPELLVSHPSLYTTALHVMADIHQAEPQDASSLKPLSVHKWRPSPAEVGSVLDQWSRRCPTLLPLLLTQLDYHAHIGVSLESQLAIGQWLCGHVPAPAPAPAPEWAWLVLRQLRVHRAWWALPLEAPPPQQTDDLFGAAYAVLSSSWGHCIPLICTAGVTALLKLAATRPNDALHCVAPVMIVMAQSPESVSLTPQFSELFSVLINSGPGLVQRALGRGPQPLSQLLLQTVLEQLDIKSGTIPRTGVVSAWLHALWSPTLPTSSILDTMLLACREWTLFDSHVGALLQEDNYKDVISFACRDAQSPLICECTLRVAHGKRELPYLWPRVLDVLHLQRVAGDRIHVDNALKHIGANMSADELMIHVAASAALTAPAHHPSHLTVWRLLLHLYLQRPPSSLHESTPPIGPLFFNGFIKSRTLGQLRKRLIDIASYHRNEIETIKSQTIAKTEPKPTKSGVDKTTKAKLDDTLLPALTIGDLTGDSSGTDTENEEDGDIVSAAEREGGTDSLDAMLSYHTGAEKMICEFIRWLEEGDKVRAMPHHADIARFIPEHSLQAAWSSELSRRRPARPAHPAHPAPHYESPRPVPPLNNLQLAVDAILNIKHSSRRSRRLSLQSPVEDVNFRDVRSLMNVVDKHLGDIGKLAREWSSEVSRISALDTALWELVRSLRVRRALPPVPKACANKCRPIKFAIPEQEWCTSTGAEREIQENRRSALAHLRHLSRARPHFARTAAALQAIARRVSSCETAYAVTERAWRCARDVAASAPAPAPAHSALTALVQLLADKWLTHDGVVCASLIRGWKNSNTLQHTLCGLLVAPSHTPAEHYVRLYSALTAAKLPSHVTFSYLSRFELSRWVRTAPAGDRAELLEALFETAQRWGATPDSEHHVLLELIGVHTATVLTEQELCAHVEKCARASIAACLPPAHWTHVVRAAHGCAARVPFDQLGHLLRAVGALWWEARSGAARPLLPPYALHVADLLVALTRGFVAGAVELSYAPERVAWYSWSAVQESWSAWVSPHPAPPLLPSTQDCELYTAMLARFRDCIQIIMDGCPGTQESLLQLTFEWAVQCYLGASGASQESRVQLSALLAELNQLPRDCQWFGGNCLQAATQIMSSTDKEITTWCSSLWRHITAETWLRVPDEQMATRLASLLCLFTAFPQHPETLEEASRFPWWVFPEAAFEEAIDRFFVQYYSPALAYHEVPQFRLLLSAAELSVLPSTPRALTNTHSARNKRARCVSACVRACAQPALVAHAKGFIKCLLDAITELDLHLDTCDEEVEQLLSRAVVIMCIEPAAATVLPVWQHWVSTTNCRMVQACLSAVINLTAFEYFVALADSAAKAYLAIKETSGWSEISNRWQHSPWTEAAPLVSRSCLHAAYGLTRAHEQTPDGLRAAFVALLAAGVNFIEQEVTVAVWICYLCRVARSTVGGASGVECSSAARSTLGKWGEEPRRSLLRVVTMTQDASCVTVQHRLLCRLALCILTPNNGSAIRSYEAACAAVAGSNTDVLAWGRTPHPKRLPRLAVRLYPNHEKYFVDELNLAPEDS